MKRETIASEILSVYISKDSSMLIHFRRLNFVQRSCWTHTNQWNSEEPARLLLSKIPKIKIEEIDSVPEAICERNSSLKQRRIGTYTNTDVRLGQSRSHYGQLDGNQYYLKTETSLFRVDTASPDGGKRLHHSRSYRETMRTCTRSLNEFYPGSPLFWTE